MPGSLRGPIRESAPLALPARLSLNGLGIESHTPRPLLPKREVVRSLDGLELAALNPLPRPKVCGDRLEEEDELLGVGCILRRRDRHVPRVGEEERRTAAVLVVHKGLVAHHSHPGWQARVRGQLYATGTGEEVVKVDALLVLRVLVEGEGRRALQPVPLSERVRAPQRRGR